ncbi:pectinesterase 2-like protein [Cinnamomum micranthum f. kanehirae]|uniref:Pectinesterase n=1 Tax=Cinnamomum micranthum f. kanehirae TaxID=337451 RepID=A0A3S3MWE3_9MAGN|nr:pectinesterase 2-like protein [Cinnamomum micranthum f. kanehirae]
MTNLDTCRTGFVELGVADNILPLINSLAINKINLVEEKYKDGFPSWLSGGDWKLLQAASPIPQADLVVVQDGSGDFQTNNEAVDAASKQERTGSVRFVIYVKAGTYRENVVIGKKLTNLMFVGDGVENTIVTGNKSKGGGISTIVTGNKRVTGDRFMARDITFGNTAGPQNHQASSTDAASKDTKTLSTSTPKTNSTENCFISGTVDFIFGNAATVLQDCTIYVRRPMDHQKNTITAQGRIDLNQTSGISIHDPSVLAAPDLISVLGSFKTFQGRPWKEFSRTLLIDPAGWLEWNGDFALNTLYYGEYRNVGPGSSTAGRVKWGGYRVITSPLEGSQFDVGNFIAGGSWLPSTGVPFTSGL